MHKHGGRVIFMYIQNIYVYVSYNKMILKLTELRRWTHFFRNMVVFVRFQMRSITTEAAAVWWSLRTPIIWNTEKVGVDEFSESFFVFYWRDYSRQLVFRNYKGLDPILELLIPSILSNIIDYAAYKLFFFNVHSNQ